jgi:methyl-accepting chemotaxis protein
LEYINSSASLAEELTRESSNLKESNELVVKKIENIVDKLNDSNESVMAISKSLGVLSNEVLQLENIKDTIKKISENTKMLSLNASIEASRVGDIGKGFAVVGSEIGKLAQRTNEEIEKIKPIIAKIQGGTRVNDDLIKVIVEQNNKILDDSKEIYANSEEVTATLNEILQEVEDIAKSNSIALDDANREQKKILEMLE